MALWILHGVVKLFLVVGDYSAAACSAAITRIWILFLTLMRYAHDAGLGYQPVAAPHVVNAKNSAHRQPIAALRSLVPAASVHFWPFFCPRADILLMILYMFVRQALKLQSRSVMSICMYR